MLTTTQDQIATVLALRPRREAKDRTPLKVLRGKRSEHYTSNVVELPRRRRRPLPEDFEPQGGDAA